MTEGRRTGFTLLELLIAITLLGLLMAGLLGGLRLGARAWDIGAERLDESARLLTVHAFLEARLDHAMPIYVADDRDREVLAFTGESDRLTLLTTLPDQLGPGLHRLTLGLAGQGPQARLVVAWRPFSPRGNDASAEADDGGRRVLLRGVERLEFGYFGAVGQETEPSWHPTWQDEDLLPTLVRLRLQFAPGDRRVCPELVVRPMIDYSVAD